MKRGVLVDEGGNSRYRIMSVQFSLYDEIANESGNADDIRLFLFLNKKGWVYPRFYVHKSFDLKFTKLENGGICYGYTIQSQRN